jgi:hypothetical protein
MLSLSLNTRIVLFLCACVPVRIILAYLPTVLDKNYLFYYGFILLSISTGFLYLYFTKSRLEAPEGGGKTWWSELRIVHGLFYLFAAIYALQMNELAYIPLSMDIVFGLIFFLIKHYYLE